MTGESGDHALSTLGKAAFNGIRGHRSLSVPPQPSLHARQP
jgi:hypothetical protein